MEAIALFSGLWFSNRRLACLIPLILVCAHDIIFDFIVLHTFSPFYPGFYWQYAAYLLLIALGRQLLNDAFMRVLWVSVSGTVVFYLISNFGVWATGTLYPQTFRGLLTSYLMGLPFFGKDLFMTPLFSCLFWLAGRWRIQELLKPQVLG